MPGGRYYLSKVQRLKTTRKIGWKKKWWQLNLHEERVSNGYNCGAVVVKFFVNMPVSATNCRGPAKISSEQIRKMHQEYLPSADIICLNAGLFVKHSPAHDNGSIISAKGWWIFLEWRLFLTGRWVLIHTSSVAKTKKWTFFEQRSYL